jgi:hypothetical protein
MVFFSSVNEAVGRFSCNSDFSFYLSISSYVVRPVSSTFSKFKIYFQRPNRSQIE